MQTIKLTFIGFFIFNVYNYLFCEKFGLFENSQNIARVDLMWTLQQIQISNQNPHRIKL